MPIPSRLMGLSFPAASAINACGDVTDNLTAIGTTQANALALFTAVNIVTVAAAGTGVVLMPAEASAEVDVFNLGANPVLVYPFRATDVINALGAGAGFSVAAGKAAKFRGRANGTGWVTILSA